MRLIRVVFLTMLMILVSHSANALSSASIDEVSTFPVNPTTSDSVSLRVDLWAAEAGYLVAYATNVSAFSSFDVEWNIYVDTPPFGSEVVQWMWEEQIDLPIGSSIPVGTYSYSINLHWRTPHPLMPPFPPMPGFYDTGSEVPVSGTFDIVPEPSTALLFGAGLLGLAAIRQRRN